MPAPTDSDNDSPDFSFLGDDQASDSAEGFDFGSISDVSESPAAPDVPDIQTDSSPPESAPTKIAAETKPESKSKPSRRVSKPLKPKKKRDRKSAPTAAAETPAVAEAESSDDSGSTEPEQQPAKPAGNSGNEPDISSKAFVAVAGYAAALTLLFLFLWATGRLSLSGGHQLESLPDLKPLQSNEFQLVPPGASLPYGHSLNLGESKRFGDVIFTPEKVTREPIRFTRMMTGEEAPENTTQPVLKLWFRLENASDQASFPPWDVSLMCHRSPAEGLDDDTNANSWLMVQQDGTDEGLRVLNFFHPPSSSFDVVDLNSRKSIAPGESLSTFVACSNKIQQLSADKVTGYRWRIQIRKGVNADSGNGVTTLVDVSFSPSDVQSSPKA